MRYRRGALAWLAVVLVAGFAAAPAGANVGYEPDAVHPSKTLPGAPKGLAVDQSNGDVYVAIVSTNPFSGTFGEISRYNSSLSANGTFATNGGYYTGVALNPVGGFFAAQMEIKGTPIGDVGTPKMQRFTTTGVETGSFPIAYSNSFPPIVSDPAGEVFVPNVNTHSVQVFSSTGTLLQEVTCSGCPGGAFGKPGSVALDSSGDLYVADVEPDRVVELAPSGGSYVYSSLIQSGRGAGAVAVDPGSGDIFVGDMPGGNNFHIVAYTSSGTQFDDFGAGLFRDASSGGYGALSTYQMAVNGTSHRLYVGEFDKFYVFERKATISPPSASTEAATDVGQLQGTMNATVNANGHAVLECEFEYTTESDFLVNGFSNATILPCPRKPNGTNPARMSIALSSLPPATSYRYRVTATSNGGTTSSGSTSFATLPELPPTVTMEAPRAVTQTGATLEAKVDPRGGAVSDCHFELGTSTAYGAERVCPTSPGVVETDVAESLPVTGLTPATTYHYRLVVETNAGTTAGSDVAFTTVSPPTQDPSPTPTAPAQGTSPPPIVSPPRSPQCRRGFRRERVGGRTRCVKVCRRGFRPRRVHGKVRCVAVRRAPGRRRS